MTDQPKAPLLVAIVLEDHGVQPIEIEVSQRALDKVLFDFNPTTDPRVLRVKALCAALVQEMENCKDGSFAANLGDVAAEARYFNAARAIDHIEVAQMVCVKSFLAKA
jgi:hypothetical protein